MPDLCLLMGLNALPNFLEGLPIPRETSHRRYRKRRAMSFKYQQPDLADRSRTADSPVRRPADGEFWIVGDLYGRKRMAVLACQASGAS
jgi:hypothetical protein